jgi:hypothetical protein
LSEEPLLLGDFNDDGGVNAADIVIWRKNLGRLSGATHSDGDADGDGAVDIDDFNVWMANFSNPLMALDGLTVPEPSAITFAFIAALLLIGQSRQKLRGRSSLPLLAYFLLSAVGAASAVAAPSLQVIPGGTYANGHLNVNGNWVWRVQISPTDPMPTSDAPLAAEIGFSESASELIGAVNLYLGNSSGFEYPIPGVPIFGWELPGVGSNGRPVGLQTNFATDEVFSAFLSGLYHTPHPKDYIQIEILGPSIENRLSSTIQWGGAYAGKGRIAELSVSSSGPRSVNWDIAFGSVSRTATPGDANLDGVVDSEDLDIFEENEGLPGPLHWFNADFDDDDDVDADDFAILQQNLPFEPGDFDEDGDVDGRDFLAWQRNPSVGELADWQTNYGNGPLIANVTTVPEPCAATLLIAGCVAILARRSADRCI